MNPQFSESEMWKFGEVRSYALMRSNQFGILNSGDQEFNQAPRKLVSRGGKLDLSPTGRAAVKNAEGLSFFSCV